MTLTASDVASLTATMGYWEDTEYFCAFLVAVACFGEYVADFTKWWERNGIWSRLGPIEERKEHLAKLSTLVLIVALVAETVCLVRTNQLSSTLTGALGDRAMMAFSDADNAILQADNAVKKSQNAEDTSGRAIDMSGQAEKAANRAVTLARSARQEADSFEKDIGSAVKQAGEAEAHLKDALARAEAAASLANGYEKQIEDARRDAAEAKALLADARQLAADAKAGVTRLRSHRSINNPEALIKVLSAYSGDVNRAFRRSE
jgi:hypothetical protein